MTVERRFYCDGPDCERFVRTLKPKPPEGSGFITAGEAIDGAEIKHFCTWDCCMKWSAQQPVAEIFHFDGPENPDA
jgi:hypothetical protein